MKRTLSLAAFGAMILLSGEGQAVEVRWQKNAADPALYYDFGDQLSEDQLAFINSGLPVASEVVVKIYGPYDEQELTLTHLTCTIQKNVFTNQYTLNQEDGGRSFKGVLKDCFALSLEKLSRFDGLFQSGGHITAAIAIGRSKPSEEGHAIAFAYAAQSQALLHSDAMHPSRAKVALSAPVPPLKPSKSKEIEILPLYPER